MDFRAAYDRLIERVTREEIADALDVSYASVKQALLPRTSSNYRNPPAGWERGFAKLARERGGELIKLADQLERGT